MQPLDYPASERQRISNAYKITVKTPKVKNSLEQGITMSKESIQVKLKYISRQPVTRKGGAIIEDINLQNLSTAFFGGF